MKKPHYSTEGQPTKTKTSMEGNVSGGGAMGQNYPTRNKPCKPPMGAQGQRLAGGSRKARHGDYASKR